MSTVNHDHGRGSRTGIPEAILAEPKSIGDLIHAIEIAMDNNGRILVTRISAEQLDPVRKLLENKHWKHEFDDFKRTLIIYSDELQIDELGAAILSAGTSDRYIVEEVRLCMRFFGWFTHMAMDVGVAGLHRFREALDSIPRNIMCLILVAGQDGALFPVVSGQTTLPVIAVPTSIGYGYGGAGETALKTALQSCAPGIAVVNIDNGFGAATMASKILSTYSKMSAE